MKSMNKGPKSATGKKAVPFKGATPEKYPTQKMTGLGKSGKGRGSTTGKFSR